MTFNTDKNNNISIE